MKRKSSAKSRKSKANTKVKTAVNAKSKLKAKSKLRAKPKAKVKKIKPKAKTKSKKPSLAAAKNQKAPDVLATALPSLLVEDSTASEILKRIRDTLSPIKLSLTNLSSQHEGHKEAKNHGGGHYQLAVVSDVFSGLDLKERQRWVMNLVSDLFGKAIHALQLDLKEPSEVPLREEYKGTLVQPLKKPKV